MGLALCQWLVSKADLPFFIWLEDHPAAEKDDYDSKQKEVEAIANPILKRAYESVNNQPSGNDDFMGEDVDGVDDEGPSVEEVP